MMRLFRRAVRRLPAVLAALMLLVGAAMPIRGASAAPADRNFDLVEALTTLQQYGLVQGDGNNDLRLSDAITRAEMVTILVRALGHEQQALFLASSSPFPDVQGHWSAGYVMVAKNLDLVGGYPDGTFQPDRPVSYAEALALLLRLVDREPTSGGWPDGVLTQAVMEGIAPPNVELFPMANEPAPRIDVFSSFYLALSEVPDRQTGKTLLQQLDSEPPVLAVDTVPTETTEGNLTISGQVSGAKQVTVAGRAARVTGERFEATVSLRVGTNEVEVRAVDAAGNETAHTLTIERIPPVARLEIEGPSQVAVGTTATYTIRAYNTAGQAITPQGVQASVSGGIGSFDAATGTLQAAATSASGSITVSVGSVADSISVRVVSPSEQVAAMEVEMDDTLVVNRQHTIRVRMLDAEGNLVTADNGRKVTLGAEDVDNVVISPSTAETVNGVATFRLMTSEAGSAVLTAVSAGLQSVSRVVDFATDVRVVIYATDSSIQPGGETTIRAKLVDADGSLVKNDTGDDIDIYLSVSGADGDVSPRTITIREDARYSDSASFVADFDEGTARIYGSIISGQNLTVETASVRIREGYTGGGGSGSSSTSYGYGLKVLGAGTVGLDDDDWGQYVVMVVDRNGNPVSDPGSYAFRIKVETEPELPDSDDDGIPDDIDIRVGTKNDDIGLDPVNETIRTENGTATIYVQSDVSAVVTLTPVGRSGGDDIPNDDDEEGEARSSRGMSMTAGHGYFQGTATSLRLTATSPVSDVPSEEAALLRAGRSDSVTLTAEVLDENNDPIPMLEGYTITLHAEGGDPDYTDIYSSTSRSLKEGKATFTIRAGDETGTDGYYVTGNKELDGTNSNIIQVAVVDEAPEGKPVITFIGGYNSEAEQSSPRGFVDPKDDYMRITLGAWDGIGAVRVYRDYRHIWTSQVVDFDVTSSIYVPREELYTGTEEYYVDITNGVGNSTKSDGETVAVGRWLTSTYITGAAYNADTNRLVISGRGFESGHTENVDPSKLTVWKDSTDNFSLGAADVEAVSSSAITLNLSGTDAAYDLETTSTYNGEVELRAAVGWYQEADGDMAEADTEDNLIEPLGHVETAELDFERRHLYLSGNGFTTGTLNEEKLEVWDGADEGSAVSVGSIYSRSDSEVVLSLSEDEVSNIQLLYGDQARLRSDVGWLTTSQGVNAAFPQLHIQRRVTVSQVTYEADGKLIIRGSGFSGTVHPEMLTLRDLNAGDVRLDDSTAQVTSDRIIITLSGDDLTGYQGLSGSDIYLIADDGWLEDAYRFEATAIPERSVPVQPYPAN